MHFLCIFDVSLTFKWCAFLYIIFLWLRFNICNDDSRKQNNILCTLFSRQTKCMHVNILHILSCSYLDWSRSVFLIEVEVQKWWRAEKCIGQTKLKRADIFPFKYFCTEHSMCRFFLRDNQESLTKDLKTSS